LKATSIVMMVQFLEVIFAKMQKSAFTNSVTL